MSQGQASLQSFSRGHRKTYHAPHPPDLPCEERALAEDTPGDSLKCSWILFRMFMLCLLSTMFTARPLLPKRPVRPIRCR